MMCHSNTSSLTEGSLLSIWDHSFLFEKRKLSHRSHLSVQTGDLAVVSLFLLKIEVRQGFHP